MSSFRICRCGCDKRMPVKIKFKSGKIIERTIKCGYCGDPVDQNSTSYRTGKWYHDQCVSHYKNFKASLESKPHSGLHSEIVMAFRDLCLFKMIERKDLRLLHKHWIIIAKEKSVPIIMRDMAKRKKTVKLNRNFIYHYRYGDPLAILVSRCAQA